MRKIKAYSYIRMSTDAQINGDSLRRQMDLSKRYADENDLELDTDFKLTDIGVSAFKGANVTDGNLRLFLEAVDKGHIIRGSRLLLEALDRLSRQDVQKTLSLFLGILNAGIDIATMSDGQLYRSGQVDITQLLLSIFIMSRAHEESAMKSLRVGAAWQHKRQQAHRVKCSAKGPGWLFLKANRQSFETIPDRVAVIHRIFSEAAAGCGSLVIAKRLNRDGIEPFGRGKCWNVSSVTKILGNRAVLGEFQPHRLESGRRIPVGEPVEGYFPAIVEPELFLRVQHGRHKRRERGGGRKGALLRNLFTGLARCGYCGSPMRFVNKGIGPKGGTYLQCSGVQQGTDCVPTGWRYDDFETAFLMFVSEIDLSVFMEDTDSRKALKAIEDQIDAQREHLRQQEARRERTMELVMESSMDKEEALRFINAAETCVRSARRALADLAVERDTYTSKLEGLTASDQHLIDHMKTLGNDERYLLRTQISSRLKDTITSLRLEVIGPAGHRRTMQDYLPSLFGSEEQDRQPSRRQRSSSMQLWAPRFEVRFATGASRTVEVRRADPTLVEDGLAVDQHGYLHPLAADGSELEPLIGSL